jgi:hypothetical protein
MWARAGWAASKQSFYLWLQQAREVLWNNANFWHRICCAPLPCFFIIIGVATNWVAEARVDIDFICDGAVIREIQRPAINQQYFKQNNLSIVLGVDVVLFADGFIKANGQEVSRGNCAAASDMAPRGKEFVRPIGRNWVQWVCTSKYGLRINHSDNARYAPEVSDRVSNVWAGIFRPIRLNERCPKSKQIRSFKSNSGVGGVFGGLGRFLSGGDRARQIISLFIGYPAQLGGFFEKAGCSGIEKISEKNQEAVETHKQSIGRLIKKALNPATFLLSFLAVLIGAMRRSKFVGMAILVWGYGWLTAIVWFGMLHK